MRDGEDGDNGNDGNHDECDSERQCDVNSIQGRLEFWRNDLKDTKRNALHGFIVWWEEERRLLLRRRGRCGHRSPFDELRGLRS